MVVDVAETAPFDQALHECARLFKIDRSMAASEEDLSSHEMTEVDTATHPSHAVDPSEVAAQQSQRPQDLIDNTSYQQENHLEACQKLGIRNPNNPQIRAGYAGVRTIQILAACCHMANCRDSFKP